MIRGNNPEATWLGTTVRRTFCPVWPTSDIGGGSDVLAEPFHAEWALDLERQCKSEGVAFFLKQLGKHPVHRGKPLELDDQHGGNWNEWPKGWRVREFPTSFRRATMIASPAA